MGAGGASRRRRPCPSSVRALPPPPFPTTPAPAPTRDPPSCHIAMTSAPLSLSRQMKGVRLGTPGGAEKPFTPTVSTRTPRDAISGSAARVRPGTSRWRVRAAGG
jgi:hypothetical protein